MPNEYDKILRETFKKPKLNLLQQILPVKVISVQPLPAKVQQTIIEREADTVLQITPDKGVPFIVHIEWQSTNDRQMALRMAKYDILLYECYRKNVMGIVIYVGEKKLTMKNSFTFFGQQYTCPIIDIRSLSPQVFLKSDDVGELLLAVLAKEGDRLLTIREVLFKLRIKTKGDITKYKEKIKHLELISQLRGKAFQKQIQKEEENMPITIDIKKDLRYQQGVLETKIESAQKMLEKGIPLAVVKEVTGLSMTRLKAICDKVKH
ncbi:putative transposase YdaD [Filimonas zeae]|uniref:Transposase (putative) YhgA-like domain-containing protein n=1 Tax=Filimonas zeae TaxID=1737353 RepID=A0A917MVG8_9BACT|nr:Rpn family recombination-promoting nuclease/putative transposase [Filimonas zeae]MDR6338889.1 putative transposase YdaD [Filimonas zeae]GGH66107.1 hypothetical protein GCM10011379_19940 [Filimonas zeae]